MRDINFFSTYIRKKQQANRKKGIAAATAIGLAVFLAGAYAASELTAMALRAKIEAMEKYQNSAEVLSKRRHAELRNKQIAILKDYIANIEGAADRINEISVINSSLLEGINKTLPAGVTFYSMSISPDNISLTGSSVSRTAIAELVHNLDGLGLFDNVHVGSIKADEILGGFAFDLQCSIKDVSGQ